MADANLIGSVGTIQGAVLETIGHHLQSQMLDALSQGWAASLGGLIFVIAVIAGVLTIAIGGQYKWGLWFLFGPAIAFWILSMRVPSTGAEWRFGDRTFSGGDLVKLNRAKEGLLGGDQGDQETAQVLRIFKYWDRFSSSVVQELVSLVRLQQSNSDVDVIAKTQRFLLLHKLEATDPRLKEFVAMAPLDKCHDYFYQAQLASGDGTTERGAQELESARTKLNQLSNQIRFDFKNYPRIGDWVRRFGYQDAYNTAFGVVASDQFTCGQLWKFAVEVFRTESESLITTALTTKLPPGALPEDFTTKLANKFARPTAEREAKVKNTAAGGNAEQNFALLVNFVTARLLLKELAETDPNVLRATMFPTPQGALTPGDDPLADAMDSWYRLNRLEEYYNLGQFLQFALTLPYLQGMGLLFLAWTLPFFVLALVVPGRHLGFLLWFGLWFWLKSWDFGMAVVMLIDKILFALMPTGPAVTEQILQNPSEAFRAVLATDPSYSSATYYTLIATCILAIPVLTGLLIKKGGGDLINALTQASNQWSSQFGSAVTAFQGSMMAQREAGQAALDTHKAVSSHLLAEMTNNVVLRNYAMSIGAATANGSVLKLNDGWIKKNGFGFLGSSGAKLLNSATESVSKAGQAYFRDAASEQLQANIDMVAYRQSNSDSNMRRASRAVGYGYFTHDFGLKYPSSQLDVVRNAANLNWGGPASNIVHQMRSEALSAPTMLVPKPLGVK